MSVTLPTDLELGNARALLAEASAVVSEVARSDCLGVASDECAQGDAAGAQVWPQPVSFSHWLSGAYLLGAGDFLRGMEDAVRTDVDLAFSSAALARSAC